MRHRRRNTRTRGVVAAALACGLAATASAVEWASPAPSFEDGALGAGGRAVGSMWATESGAGSAWLSDLSALALPSAQIWRLPDRPSFPRSASAGSWSQVVADQLTAQLRGQPLPAAADAVLPEIKAIFAGEGVPPELAWIAAVESAFDPRARNPSGAAGLFQFKPATAERFGLRTEPQDERMISARSAQAAARYLRLLHARFGCWSLAVAAYNAGEGRIGRTLEACGANTFDEIVERLPLQTRFYVPKVMAVVGLRENVSLDALPPPAPLTAAARAGPGG